MYDVLQWVPENIFSRIRELKWYIKRNQIAPC